MSKVTPANFATCLLSLREEPIDDSALIEDFDGPCVQAARA
jgi:hypothetical protein